MANGRQTRQILILSSPGKNANKGCFMLIDNSKGHSLNRK